MITPRWTPGIEKVLAHMRTTEGWHVTPGGLIRRDLETGDSECCPISSLEGANEVSWKYVAQRHNITEEEASDVVNTADGNVTLLCYDPALRAAMLEAGRIDAHA